MASSPPPGRNAQGHAQGPPLQTPNYYMIQPEKRQKLSHGPSPLGTSPVGSTFPPYSPQWSPHSTQPPPMQSQTPSVHFYPPNPLESFNQPQPVQSPAWKPAPKQNAGVMGPPERPQKPIDPNDITDMVALSGVDLHAEDEYLAQSYNRPSSFSNSFETQQSSTQSAGNSFNQWTQGNYGSQPAFSAHTPFNQTPATPKSLEEEMREKAKRAARQLAQSKQAHLQNPFLAADPMRHKLHQHAYAEHVRFDASRGVNPPSAHLKSADVQAKVLDVENGTGLVAAKVRVTVETDSPLVEVLTLLSLACQERVRTMLEDAFAVSRARQHGSHGVVPPEWASIADGVGTAEPATAASLSITQTPWDQPPQNAISPSTLQPASSIDPSSGRLPTPPTEPSPQPQSTIAYTSPIPTLLQSVASTDREAEKRRLERRRKRQKDRQASTTSETVSPSTPNNGIGSATPNADSTGIAPKMTKKALAAEKKSAVNDEVARKQANATANYALGNKSKKYAWLNAGANKSGGGLTAGAGMGRGMGTTPKGGSTPGTPGVAGSGGQAVVVEDPGMRSREVWKRLGMWREDGERGRGVQIRDFVSVLEREGLEKKTLGRCLARLRSDEKER